MNYTDNSNSYPSFREELDMLEAETFEIRDHAEVEGEVLGSCSTSCSCCSSSSTSCTSCSSCE